MHNNYYENENSYGFPIFSTFIEDINGLVDYTYYGGKYNYVFFANLNGVEYYKPKHTGFSITERDINPPTGIGYYDLVIHGQTMNVYMPQIPQNLYYITE